MAGTTPLERIVLLAIAVFTALAGVADYGAWAAVPRFAMATVALAGLAWVVSFATEQLGERFGPGVTGMMQSTLGNLPELFVVIFALQKAPDLSAARIWSGCSRFCPGSPRQARRRRPRNSTLRICFGTRAL